MASSSFASFKEVLTNIKSLPEYIAAQRNAGRDIPSILNGQLTATRAKIKLIGHLELNEATELTDEITNGPWNEEQKQDLLAVVDQLTLSHGSGQHRRKNQHCLHFEQYLTEEEWDALTSDAFISAKIAQLAQRAFSLGITCPSEPTSFRITQILARSLNLKQSLSNDQFDDLFQRVKSAIKEIDATGKYPHQHLVNYPASPFDLPSDMYDWAYQESPPIETNIPELSMRTPGHKMRGGKNGNEDVMGKRFVKVVKTMMKQAQDGDEAEPKTNFTTKRDTIMKRELAASSGLNLAEILARSSKSNVKIEHSPSLSLGNPYLEVNDEGAEERPRVSPHIGNSMAAFRSQLPATTCAVSPRAADRGPAPSTSPLVDSKLERPASSVVNVRDMEQAMALGKAEATKRRRTKSKEAEVPVAKRPAAAPVARPAAAAKPVARPAAAAKKRPAAAAAPVARPKGCPPMPDIDARGPAKPVTCFGRRVYIDKAKQAFRAILEPGSYASEIKRSYVRDAEAAWTHIAKQCKEASMDD